ncbi:methyl-accepting chemotaxis protein [Pseudomonas sp. UL073]|uniref:Methyl-accepting chemotaxis protein n=1 Tax=Zestomonas insulae TaxID=2809017 RepID=A0ABS2ID70_9GAMM|nr:methyl-accepting chemotaxis protein [Pseudomonas insulae]MBM7061056.1 methyl-accepting chemotaxis protein [Pseudomonas insulae]
MPQLLRTLLNDMPVGQKLLVAFGLVTLLSLAAIGITFQSSNSLLSDSSEGQSIAEINLLLLQARNAERDFAVSPDQGHARRVEDAISKLGKRVAELLRGSDSAAKKRLEQIRVSSEQYLDQFRNFAASSQDAGQALKEMQKQADEARIQFEFVELDMLDSLRESQLNQSTADPATLTQAESASRLMRMLLAIRVLEFAFVEDGGEKRLLEWRDIVQGIAEQVARLKVSGKEEHQDVLQAAEDAVIAYRAAFERYSDRRVANERSSIVMRQLADHVLQQANDTLAAQRKSMEARAHAVIQLLCISAIVILVLAALAGWAVRQLILPPLRQTLEVARVIAAGDLRQTVMPDRRDELGRLGQAMGAMASNLRGLAQRIAAGVEQLHLSAGELQQASLISNEGALAQQRESELAATSTQEMARSAQAVSRHAEQASEAAVQANQQASAGERIVRQSANQIGLLARELDGSRQAIRELHQSSERIGGVLDVIKAVAEQTNLLALNAAIEAARAGEQGRGFAVVADEVRGLAQRTQHSTSEIEQLVAELQSMSASAVQRMTRSAELGQEAVAFGEEAQQALGLITQAVSSIEELNLQIADAATEQSRVADEISQNVERVYSIADQGAHATRRVSDSSADLARLGSELQVLVRQFRTE